MTQCPRAHCLDFQHKWTLMQIFGQTISGLLLLFGAHWTFLKLYRTEAKLPDRPLWSSINPFKLNQING